MNLQELIEALDQRYGNPHAKECHLIQEAIQHLRKYEEILIKAQEKWVLQSCGMMAWKLLNGLELLMSFLNQCLIILKIYTIETKALGNPSHIL